MPISADQFDEIDDSKIPRPGTNADRILSFLERNADKAFTQTKIGNAMDVKRGSVGPTLVRLREDGRVEYRGNYWRVSDHLESLDDATAHASAVADSHEAKPFEYDEWIEHAVDPREERE